MVNGKKGMELKLLGEILLGLAAAVLIFFAIKIFTGKGSGAVDFIKSFLP